jgi:hypothetical protein
MEESAYIGELLAGIVYLIVGIRLLRLGQRTREAPERLLGAMFFLTGASYIVYSMTALPGFESLWTPLNFAGRVIYIGPPILLAVFTRKVFRPADPWAAWLVYGIAVLIIGGIGGSALGGDWEGFSISNRWFWLEWVGYTIPFGWAGSEAFVQYRRARRRVRLGVCDPLVCNRLLLWALFGSVQVCAGLVILPQYSEYETTSQFTATWDTLMGGLEFVSVTLIGLVFFAPAFYQRWINGQIPVENAAEG